MDARNLRRRITQFHRRYRRPLAAALAFLAVLAALSVLRPTPPPASPVLVAARDLPAGTVLSTADLTALDVPAPHVPPGALTDTAQAVGRLLSAPMRAGEALTQTRLVDAALSNERGTYAVPLRLADAEVVGLLVPGMRIDVVRQTRGSPEVLADDVRVITVPRRGATSAFSGSGASAAGSLVLVAADRMTAIRLAAAGTDGDLAAIVR